MSLILQAIDRWVAERPDAVALRSGAGLWPWAALADEIAAASQYIQSHAPGDAPVAIALDNGPAWVVIDLALIKLGRPCVPVPVFFTEAQASAAYAAAGVCAVVHAGDAFDVAGERLSVSSTGAPAAPLHPGTAKVTFTSGSTGAPKGVCLSLAQMEWTAQSIAARLSAFVGVHLAVLPLGVLLENVAGLYPQLLAGGVYHVAPLAEVGFAKPFQPDFARLATAVQDAHATSLILAPEILRGLLATLAARRLELPTLTFVAVGGAKVSPTLLAQARALGLPAYQGYGLSECGSVVALNIPGDDRAGSVGRPLAHLSVRITPDGEIAVGPHPFLGYIGGPPHAGEVFSGDLGAVDGDGYLSVLGRRSNTIITAFGRNVSPEWVESELLSQPQIAQAMVFGEAQAALGALVAPTPGTSPEAVGMAVDRANAALPEYAQVRRWRVVAPFDPMKGELTPNGRPRRPVLAAAYADFIHDHEGAACPSLPA